MFDWITLTPAETAAFGEMALRFMFVLSALFTLSILIVGIALIWATGRPTKRPEPADSKDAPPASTAAPSSDA